MGGLHDAGAVGELVHGGGEHQGGGAAVGGGQRAGGVENLEGAEQRVVAALTGVRGSRSPSGPVCGFGEGVEQGLEVLGRLAGQLAGDRALTRPHAGAATGCDAGARPRCHETPRPDRRGRTGRSRTWPAGPDRGHGRSRAARSHTAVPTGRRADRRSCPSSPRPWPRPGSRSHPRPARPRSADAAASTVSPVSVRRGVTAAASLTRPAASRAPILSASRSNTAVFFAPRSNASPSASTCAIRPSCFDLDRLLLNLQFAQPIQHCRAGQRCCAHMFDSISSEEETPDL